jgi:hypothetical protein
VTLLVGLVAELDCDLMKYMIDMGDLGSKEAAHDGPASVRVQALLPALARAPGSGCRTLRLISRDSRAEANYTIKAFEGEGVVTGNKRFGTIYRLA